MLLKRTLAEMRAKISDISVAGISQLAFFGVCLVCCFGRNAEEKQLERDEIVRWARCNHTISDWRHSFTHNTLSGSELDH
jgi:hypothetical protein